jgi:hypothetical protein
MHFVRSARFIHPRLSNHACPPCGPFNSVAILAPDPFAFFQSDRRETPQFLAFVFNRLRTLPSSVSYKSFACHSYENCRVSPQQFPFWFIPSETEGNSCARSQASSSFFPFNHLRDAHFATLLFSHSCKLVGGHVPPSNAAIIPPRIPGGVLAALRPSLT